MPPLEFPSELTVHDFGGPEGATTLMLMHGLTDSGECWTDAAARWVPRYRVLAWDARGHGTSARFTRQQLDAGVGETMLSDAVALLEALCEQGVERPVLVGHSMGGGTAGAVAATRPDLVRATVLEDPALGEDPTETMDDRLRVGDQRISDAQEWHDDPDGALAKGMADNEGWPPSEYAGWARAKTQTDLSMLATGQARVRRTWQDVAADIAVPSLVLTCDDPLLWDDAKREELQGLGNPNLQVEKVEGAGHCIRRSKPDAFHRLVDPWLEQHA
jgi:pimeloyl-ACP methyl ester carboxylesterase